MSYSPKQTSFSPGKIHFVSLDILPWCIPTKWKERRKWSEIYTPTALAIQIIFRSILLCFLSVLICSGKELFFPISQQPLPRHLLHVSTHCQGCTEQLAVNFALRFNTHAHGLSRIPSWKKQRPSIIHNVHRTLDEGWNNVA